jgi:predicted nucleic acid-binding protein
MLIDSNILIYSINSISPNHKNAKKFIQDNLNIIEIAHQNILETVKVLTHKKHPNPMTAQQALRSVLAISNNCMVISPNRNTHHFAIEIIKDYKLTGVRIFDGYLAATALSNGIFTIATDNTRDFKKFKELKIINPFTSAKN